MFYHYGPCYLHILQIFKNAKLWHLNLWPTLWEFIKAHPSSHCFSAFFSNDMFMHPSVMLIQYADDSALAVCGEKEELSQLINQLEIALATAKEWFFSRKMKINTAKTQLATFGTKQLLQGIPPIRIKVDGEMITESYKVGNLDITMDRHMTFRPHLDQITGCCTRILLGLTATRHWLPREVMVLLFNSLVMSRLRYCPAVYGNASVEIRDRIQELINFSARTVTGLSKRDHVSEVVRSLQWMRAPSLYQYTTSKTPFGRWTSGSE